MWTVAQICEALENEREIARQPIRAQALRVVSTNGGVRVDVEPMRDRFNRRFDEALEGAKAWWPGNPPTMADVFAVDPDELSIFLRRLTGRPPDVGETISVYEPDYSRPLVDLWNSPSIASAALAALATEAGTVEEPSTTLDLHYLRVNQRRALGLSRHHTSLLHGPPGTGKTKTLGALVAEEIVSGRSARVIVAATTHTAVDQAVRAVDDALEVAGQLSSRSKVKRFGSRVDPKFFVGREHLLPVQDQDAFEKLTNLLDSEPRKTDLEAWSDWKQQVEVLRGRLRTTSCNILTNNSCVGMTIASAFFWFRELLEVGIDLVVIDEASQLGGPAAQMIAVSAKRSLFAGDPKQLSAVVRTTVKRAREILSATVFEIAGNAPRVLLDEQSRMASPICHIVSNVFYDGELIVAKDHKTDKNWLKYRSPNWIEGKKQPQFQVINTDALPNWSSDKKYNGRIRYGSAQAILNLLDDMLGAYVDPADILVLTPFRAQRAMLRTMLGARRTRGIDVSTVHRAQGRERKIVIFDPVDGASKFLSGEEGDRLINVAISRAKAQVVIFMSQQDRQNATLRRIAVLAGAIENPNGAGRSRIPSLKEFAARKDFPSCLRGQLIRVGSTEGEVVTLEKGGDVIVIACRETGLHRKFKTKIALKME